MDRHTLDIIDFHRVRQMLAEQANCALGRQKALKLKPTNRIDLIEGWLKQLSEMIEAGSYADLPPFGGIHDIRGAVRAAVPPHCLEPEDLAVVAETLNATHNIVNWVSTLRQDATALRQLCEGIGDFKAIGEAIQRVVDAKGRIRDDASAKLKKIRTDIANARISIGHVVDRLLRNKNMTRLLRYSEATFHDDRLVLPLAAEYRGRVPGIVHRSSDSGATLFVEPAEAVELNNQIISLKADETAEIGRLLWHLAHLIQINREEILKTLDTLTILDLIVAKVRFARIYKATCPNISQDGKLQLNQARHPMLVQMANEAQQRSQEFEVVPIDVRLGDDFDVLVVTGPNTGGKTVALKTVALLCAMTQAGLPIMAKPGSQVPIYNDILVDIGDEQSMQQSLSTFSAHLMRLMVILKGARANTLVLIDELGAGTDPDEGAALGQAMVMELLERGCPTLVTTHLGVLKSLAYTEGRAENACVDFDPKTLKPTYRLLIGEPGNSNAINIADRLGLPKKMLTAARQYLSGSHQQLARAIKGTLLSRRQAERARTEAEEVKSQALQQKQAAERELKELQDRQEDFQKWIQMILTLRPGDEVHVKRFDKPGTIVRMQLHKQLAVVSVGAMEMEVPIRELGPST